MSSRKGLSKTLSKHTAPYTDKDHQIVLISPGQHLYSTIPPKPERLQQLSCLHFKAVDTPRHVAPQEIPQRSRVYCSCRGLKFSSQSHHVAHNEPAPFFFLFCPLISLCSMEFRNSLSSRALGLKVHTIINVFFTKYLDSSPQLRLNYLNYLGGPLIKINS